MRNRVSERASVPGERERRWRTAVEDPAAGSRTLLASAAALVATMEWGEGRLGIKP